MLDSDSFGIQFARSQAIAIAKDVTDTTPREFTSKLLDWVTSTFEKWKCEQAAPDGTIEIELMPGLLGAFGDGGDWSLGDLANPEKWRRRVHYSKLRPEQCGGFGVKSSTDLLLKLLGERHPAVMEIEKHATGELAMASLLARDASTMPIGSIALAVRYLWIAQLARLEMWHSIWMDNECRQAAQGANARAAAKLEHERQKRARDETTEKLAIEAFCAHPAATNAEVAAIVHARVKDWKGFALVTPGGIARRLAKPRKAALALLARTPR